MSHNDAPDATNEARMRWVQRAGETVSVPSDYWGHAWPLENHGLHADEARYVPSHDVILVRKETAITTVIGNDANLRPEARAAIQRARHRNGGGGA